jgi:hypothetical protein
MRKLLTATVIAVATAGVAALAGPAQAAPTNSPKALFFTTVCTNLDSGVTMPATTFVVQGNEGRAGAHSAAGIFQPLTLDVTVNGEPETIYAKANAGRAEWSCSGQTTVQDPESGESVTIAFVATGNFHP